MKKIYLLALISCAALFTQLNAGRGLTNKTEETVKLLLVMEMQKKGTNLQMHSYSKVITLSPGQTISLPDNRNYFYMAKEKLPQPDTWVHEAAPELFGTFVGNTGEWPLSSTWMRVIHYDLVQDRFSSGLRIVENK